MEIRKNKEAIENNGMVIIIKIAGVIHTNHLPLHHTQLSTPPHSIHMMKETASTKEVTEIEIDVVILRVMMISL